MKKIFTPHSTDPMGLHQPTRPIEDCQCIRKETSPGHWQTVVEAPVLTCDCLWRIYQQMAEDIVAPGGVLISDPKERNRQINMAYAKLWLEDHRFQWAGLAAFASKQVGCGLLHANQLIDESKRDIEVKNTLPNWLLNREMTASQIGFDAAVMSSSAYMYNMLALGNTTLFLDIYPLHLFYKKRGLDQMKQCLKRRPGIYGNPKFPVMWPISQEILRFGEVKKEVIDGFAAIDSGDIPEGVRQLASHEQRNILQKIIYDDRIMQSLLLANQAAYVTDLLNHYTEAIQLTLSNQCKPLNDGRTERFSNSQFADLSDVEERMRFVNRAAAKFNQLLHSNMAGVIGQSIVEISQGGGNIR
ncbi:MAG TPA: hypothetical protein VFX23_00440 [Limnobacter sp.]|uniref:DUF2515 family protein n=1 Tax=Limnobacter sp. TaxID=2003368 RepID=UPI002E37E06E|nr:hypothetical protein [Limnobacter sp.]HEX5484439.1 hypothetical protein [Limnobacter sp.]